MTFLIDNSLVISITYRISDRLRITPSLYLCIPYGFPMALCRAVGLYDCMVVSMGVCMAV